MASGRQYRRREAPKDGGYFLTSFRAAIMPGWPFLLGFTGRSEGMETLCCYHTKSVVWRGTLGILGHHLQIGFPPKDFPKDLWPAHPMRLAFLLNDWFAEKGHRRLTTEDEEPSATTDEVFQRAPLTRIMLKPAILREGLDPVKYRALQAAAEAAYREGSAQGRGFWQNWREPRWRRTVRAPAEYLHAHSRLTFYWYAQDTEAAAWCEILHAWRMGATARRCEVCEHLFIRPRGYPIKMCPTCREITWRQHARIRTFHRIMRPGFVLKVWQANVERRQLRETDWTQWKALEQKLLKGGGQYEGTSRSR